MDEQIRVRVIHSWDPERVVLPRAASRRGSSMITIASRTQQRSDWGNGRVGSMVCSLSISMNDGFLTWDPQNHGDSMPTAKNEFGWMIWGYTPMT